MECGWRTCPLHGWADARIGGRRAIGGRVLCTVGLTRGLEVGERLEVRRTGAEEEGRELECRVQSADIKGKEEEAGRSGRA